MVEAMGFESIAPIVSEMSADERTDLIESLPDDVGEKLLETVERVDPEAAAEVEALAKWPEDSAGGLMTTGYMAVKLDLRVHDVIESASRRGRRQRPRPSTRCTSSATATSSSASRRCAICCSPIPRRASST